MKRIAPILLFILASANQALPARADWSDLTPEWSDKSAAPQQPAPPAPRRVYIESDLEWAQRPHTPQEYEARVRLLQGLMKTQQLQNLQRPSAPPVPTMKLPAGAALPGSPEYKSQNVFTSPTNQTPFFNGLTPEQAAQALSKPVYHFDRTDTSPAWAKQAVPRRHFVDGVEHFGNEDSMGFLDSYSPNKTPPTVP